MRGIRKAVPSLLRKDIIAFTSGYSIEMQDLKTASPLSMAVTVESDFYFSIGFQLAGKGAMTDAAAKKSTTPFQGHGCRAGILRGANDYKFHKVEAIRSVNVNFTRQGLERVLGDGMEKLPKAFQCIAESDSEGYAREFCNLSPAMLSAAHQAFQCKADAPHNTLFLESKALELVSLFLMQTQSLKNKEAAHSDYIPP